MSQINLKASETGIDRIFEYQVFDHGRWVTMQAFMDENLAIDTAQAAIQEIRYDRVRVLSIRAAGETSSINRVVFQKEVEGPMRDVRVGELFDRPVICQDSYDLYKANARLILNRLLTEYCHQKIITVSEILHSRLHFRQLKRNEELMGHVIDHVARLQSTFDVSASERVGHLQQLVMQFSNHLDCLPSGDRASDALERFYALAPTVMPDDQETLLILGAVWSEIISSRSTILSKITITLEIGQTFGDAIMPPVIALQDLQMADLLFNSESHDLLFGPFGSRGELIYFLLALAESVIGDYGPKPRPIGDDVRAHLDLLKSMFARGRLSCARDHLISLAVEHLSNSSPLDHRDQHSNHCLFRQIIELLAVCPVLLNEPRLVMAITKRVSRHANVQSGNLSVESRHVGVLMKHPAMAIIYWVRLHDQTRNQDLKRSLGQRIVEMVEAADNIRDLIPGRLSIQQWMTQLTACYTALKDSTIHDRMLS